MLLDNFTFTLYPNLKTTNTGGSKLNNTSYMDFVIGTLPSDAYSESGSISYHNPYNRGIAFGSGTTPPPENRL